MKVSVILPVYNVEPYLDEALKSLTSQTLGDIEIIAINDGSTDHSEEILKRYQEQYPFFSYYNQPNQGQSAARNHALRYAQGEYNLGYMYEKGLCVVQNIDQAIGYYRSIVSGAGRWDKVDDHYARAKRRLSELGMGNQG